MRGGGGEGGCIFDTFIKTLSHVLIEFKHNLYENLMSVKICRMKVASPGFELKTLVAEFNISGVGVVIKVYFCFETSYTRDERGLAGSKQ